MTIDIRHIRQVETLARHKNFARAAKELNMTQPGLSRAIQSLEDSLGMRLFDRHIREITPTIFGQHIIKFGKTLLKDAQRMQTDLQILKEGDKGELRIGSGPIPAEIFMGKVLGMIMSSHPKLHIYVIVERPSALLEMLKKREIDVMIGDTRPVDDMEGLEVTDLPQHPICYVCRPDHPMAGRKTVRLEHILAYPVATPWIPDIIYEVLSQETGLPISEIKSFENGIIECSYFKLLIDVVLTSDAIGCGLFPIFHDHIDRKELVSLPFQCSSVTSNYKIITLSNYLLSPAVIITKEHLLKHFGQKQADTGAFS